jgi:hypothetical protein
MVRSMVPAFLVNILEHGLVVAYKYGSGVLSRTEKIHFMFISPV